MITTDFYRITAVVTLGVVCLCIGLLLRWLLIPQLLPRWFQKLIGRKSAPELRGFPVLVEGSRSSDPTHDLSGMFRIVGVDRITNQQVRLDIAAETMASAQVKAELNRVIVTRIIRLQSEPSIET